ncbi:DNA adenine methylase [Promicromonospora soli]
MASHVRDAVSELKPNGRVVDLFSGMGSVAEALQETAPVVTNDALSFTAAISRARFTGRARSASAESVMARLKPTFEEAKKLLAADYDRQLKDERKAVSGDSSQLSAYMDKARHAGNSPEIRRAARAAAEASGVAHYRLAAFYFSAGFLSLSQAIDADALRAAIDAEKVPEERDWLIGSWIAAISVVINSPGHTAQYLRPNTESARARLVRTWQRDLWSEFQESLETVDQVGTEHWRSQNGVYVSDALDLVSGGSLMDIGAVYADPPYTKDQYSRFYHVYETLYRYDYPDSNGAGRSRTDRFSTGFSLKTAVAASFHDLCRNVQRMDVPLVISYPSSGLLGDAGFSVAEIAGQYFSGVEVLTFDANHSTMGASKGASKKRATENLYVCAN